tara:strand:- start:1657 stop:2682 length:1026 start_codon:yes stop_codon:yes gene_type:complete
MATTQITDVYVPEVYASYTAVNGPEKTAFFDAGVAVTNPALATMFSEGGRIGELPFWKDLDASDEPNYGTDDPADVATPAKITTGIQVARMASLNQGYSSADLTGELAGADPMQQVRNRFGTYWMRQWQRRTICSLQGVIADNITNDGGDMVNSIAGATNADVAAGTLFSRQAFTTAAFTSGDHFDDYVAIAVHSVVYKRMVDNDDIDFIPDSQGVMSATFMGRRVIVDDGLPMTAAAGSGPTDAAATYTSFLFGTGLIGYGERAPKVPVELEREAAQGNGAGVETLWERKAWVIHPFGTAFTSTTLTDGNATWAQLRLAANWDRVVERKNVPLSAIISNG